MYIRNVDDFLSILKWIANTSPLQLRLKLYKKGNNLYPFLFNSIILIYIVENPFFIGYSGKEKKN